jgi:fatty acid desaturase
MGFQGVPTLRFTADRRTLVTVGLFYALMATAFALPLSLGSVAILMPALCLVSFLCAVIAHNSVHAPIFRTQLWNRAFQAALSPAYGHPVTMFVPGHNLSHHQHLQKPKDAMRTDKVRFRSNLLNQVLFAWMVAGPITRDNILYAWSQRRRRPVWFAQLLLELAAYLTLIVAAGILDWKKLLLFVVLPHQYAAWGIMGINFVQHDGCDAATPHHHSRNFVGRGLNWLTFNNGFHGIHHLHPGLHWSLLPAAHAKEVAPFIHPGLEQKSLIAYCWGAYVKPGRRVRYDGAPLELGPPRQDIPWVPDAASGAPSARSVQEDFGAVGSYLPVSGGNESSARS